MATFKQGEILKAYRKKNKWTQKQCADAFGVSKNHISFIERCQAKPNADLLLDYIKTFEIPLDAFF